MMKFGIFRLSNPVKIRGCAVVKNLVRYLECAGAYSPENQLSVPSFIVR